VFDQIYQKKHTNVNDTNALLFRRLIIYSFLFESILTPQSGSSREASMKLVSKYSFMIGSLRIEPLNKTDVTFCCRAFSTTSFAICVQNDKASEAATSSLVYVPVTKTKLVSIVFNKNDLLRKIV